MLKSKLLSVHRLVEEGIQDKARTASLSLIIDLHFLRISHQLLVPHLLPSQIFLSDLLVSVIFHVFIISSVTFESISFVLSQLFLYWKDDTLGVENSYLLRRLTGSTDVFVHWILVHHVNVLPDATKLLLLMHFTKT